MREVFIKCTKYYAMYAEIHGQVRIDGVADWTKQHNIIETITLKSMTKMTRASNLQNFHELEGA